MNAVGERKPITRIRSEWVERDSVEILGCVLRSATRNVHDGLLYVIAGEEPIGWHLSISHRGPNGPRRYPTWDEIAHARDVFLPADVDFVMFLPKAGEYVALHDTTFHLHEYHEPVRGGEA